MGLSDQQLADLVRSDQIDILVDLAMHTANNRLLTFARKPAPVQVTWLAYPGTTGLPAIDYRLTDPFLDPPGLFDAHYVEKSVRLPETFWCFDPLIDTPPVNALPAMASGIVTFGCLNNFCKVNDDCLALWARVLLAVPRSRLLLHAPKDQARERVLSKLEQEGITASRVEFVDRQPRLDYFRLYHRMDVALDPLPCNGGTTSLDAFWMGIPTLTLVGTTVVGRAGWSQLCNLGLQELAAESPEQFVALAARLAGDLPKLQELRGTLRERMLRSPLMDGKRFARHVEQAFRQMWHQWCHLGNVFINQEKLPEAVASFQEAARLRPDLVVAHNNLGNALLQAGRPAEAVGPFQQAPRLQGDHADAHHCLGNAFKELGNLEEAVASYQRAIRLKPDFAEAHGNLALAWLLLGNFEHAWPEYEWRWKCQAGAPFWPGYRQPLWDGSPLNGRTILLHGEQGLGDILQFIRYAPLVKDRGGRVVVGCPEALLPLLSSCRGIDRLTHQALGPTDFELWAPLLSLPRILGTSLTSIPAEVPYLSVDAELSRRWRREIGSHQAFRIGIHWQGNPKHLSDRQRSFPLAQFAPLAALTGVQLFSLQKGQGVEQLGTLATRFPITDLGSRLNDFIDAAAVMKNLDLVICCDTAIAHLAGALAVPVWLALPFVPDWRWLLNRDDSPWYPTMRLFRQPRPGAWEEVFARIVGAVQQQLTKSAGTRPGT